MRTKSCKNRNYNLKGNTTKSNCQKDDKINAGFELMGHDS